jgi:branched-chain amino acid transport system permease protein
VAVTGRSSARRIVPAAAVVALVVMALAAPLVLAPYPLTLLSLVCIAALLASSVNLLVGQVGLLSMGQAGISAAAGYAIAWGAVRDADPLVQVALAVGVTLLVSVVYGVMTMRTNGIVFLMITLALGMIVFGLAQKTTSVTGGQNGLTGVRRPELVADPGAFYLLTFLALLVSLGATLAITRSSFGLILRGVRESEGRMSSLGYPVARLKFVAMVCAGLFAGCAGILAAWQAEFMSPATAGFSRSAFAVVMVIVGGTGTLLGPLVGAGVVVGIEHWLSSYVERWPTLLGVVLIVVVLFARGGVVGAVQDLVRRIRPGAGGGHGSLTTPGTASGGGVAIGSGTGTYVAPAGPGNEEVRG